MLIAGLASCKRNITTGEGATSSETRAAGSFDRIAIEVPVKAIIKVDAGQQTAIEISGYKNLLHLIKTEIKNNTLRIYKEELTHFNTDKDITVTISAAALTRLSISGAGEAEIAGALKADNFNLDISGAGDVTIDNIIANTFIAGLSGAGSLEVNGGNVNKAVYTVTGAGDISAFPMVARQTIAHVTGAGDVEVNTTENLEASITGAGSVSYKGHPAIKQNTTGAGSVEDAN